MTTEKTKLVIKKRGSVYTFKRGEDEYSVHNQIDVVLLLGAMIGATINNNSDKNYEVIINLTSHVFKN